MIIDKEYYLLIRIVYQIYLRRHILFSLSIIVHKIKLNIRQKTTAVVHLQNDVAFRFIDPEDLVNMTYTTKTILKTIFQLPVLWRNSMLQILLGHDT